MIEQPGIAIAESAGASHNRLFNPFARVGLALGLALGAAACSDSSAVLPSPTSISHSSKALELSRVKHQVAVNKPAPDAKCLGLAASTHIGEVVNFGTSSNPSYGLQKDMGSNDRLAANGDGGVLISSDAFGKPIINPSDKVAALKQKEATICVNPLAGTTEANQLATLNIDGVVVASVNPWLERYNFDASPANNDINNLADSFFSIKNPDGSEAQTVQDNARYELFAERIITLLNRFQNDGTSVRQTTKNYVDSAGRLTGAMGTPEVRINPNQYLANATWLELTKKQGGCYAMIGFNNGDQRPVQTDVCTTKEEHKNGSTSTSNGNYYYPTTTLPQPTTTILGSKVDQYPGGYGGSTTTVPGGGEPTPSIATTTTTQAPRSPGTTIPGNGSTTTAPLGGWGNTGP